jgi:hypothetical protein
VLSSLGTAFQTPKAGLCYRRSEIEELILRKGFILVDKVNAKT